MATQADSQGMNGYQILPTRKQLMCKVAWMRVEREIEEKDDNGETIVRKVVEQPEPSKVPLTLIKEKAPLKLLEFYESLYFQQAAPVEKRKR